MRNIKTFENWKGDYLNSIKDIIDECMMPLVVFKFKKKNLDLQNRYNPKAMERVKNFKFITEYTREQTSDGLIQVNGYIENGKIIYTDLNPDNKYSPQYEDFVVNEFTPVIEQIASIIAGELGDNQMNFSFSNHGKKEVIMIFIPKDQKEKSWM